MPDLFRELVESSPDAQLLVNDQGIIVYANAYAHSLFGYGRGALCGRAIDLLVPPRSRTGHARHRQRYLAAPTLREMGSRDAALSGLRGDGTTFPAQIRLAPIATDEGTLTAAVVRDTSQIELTRSARASALQAAEAAGEAKSRFLAAASHDLRQPLQSLRLINATLQRQTVSAEVRALLENEARSLDAMSQLLHALLNVVKLESGAMLPHVEEISVTAMFDDLRRQFADLAAAKGVALDVEAAEVYMHTDRTLMSELLQNLLANAIRYTDEGRVVLRMIRHSPSCARIEVQDTGVGIPPEIQDRIFDDFYQLKGQGREHRGGFGLGLGIVRRVAQLLELPLSVNSRVNEGTTFNIEVAIRSRSDASPEPEAPGAPSPRAAEVLLVEDEAAVRAAMKMFLEMEGHTVRAVGSLAELDGLLADIGEPPDLVITDFQLSLTERGTDVIQKLAAKFATIIPAIVLTGDTSGVPGHALRGARTQLLNKPVDGPALLLALSTLLNEDSSPRA